MKNILKKIVIWLLALEAQAILRKHEPKIVGVTGSVGKTSTKEAIYTALSGSHFVRKSEKSFNSGFGVPLTILGRESGWNDPIKWLATLVHGAVLLFSTKKYPEMLVLEIGADRPGDIKALTRWVKPDVAVITGLPEIPAHVEFFDSAESVAEEKKELAKALKKGGHIVGNGDEDRVWEMRNEFRGVTKTYGFRDRNEVQASHVAIEYEKEVPVGMHFRVNMNGSSVPVAVRGAVGKTQVYPILAACGVGTALGMDLVSIGKALEGYVPISGRMRLREGASGSTLIDDTYNASPIAMISALETLGEVKTKGRKIAVLGDMLELGKYSADAHRAAGTQAAAVADLLIVVGIRARGIAQAAIEAGFPEERIRRYEQGESEQAGADLLPVVQEGDVVLLKGSQGLRLEKAVKALLRDPSKANELLVRQDDYWLKR